MHHFVEVSAIYDFVHFNFPYYLRRFNINKMVSHQRNLVFSCKKSCKSIGVFFWCNACLPDGEGFRGAGQSV